ncbi:ferritin-like domain-containing protein [bacterium]|nr:ferritin-like domain-containing protein [bacterium]
MAGQDLIDGLNHALNREVSTFLRYMLQAASIRGAEWESVRQMYLAEVADEVGHAQYLSNKIVMLGGTPRLEPDLTPPPSDPRAMLERDGAAEKIDVEHYMRLAGMADKAGLFDLKMKMEEQAADEAEHAELMARLLGDRVGVAR